MFCFVKQKHRVILSSYTVFLKIIGYEVICLLLGWYKGQTALSQSFAE